MTGLVTFFADVLVLAVGRGVLAGSRIELVTNFGFTGSFVLFALLLVHQFE